MDNEGIRTFIAIELPHELKDSVANFQSALKDSRLKFVKWVDPKLMHLTLKFLGNQSASKVEVIKNVMGRSAVSCQPFTLTSGQTGGFPGLQKIRVYWLGLSGDLDKLTGLQKDIDEALAKEGFPGDNRPFAAHLTLARLKDECSMQDRTLFSSAIKNVHFEPGANFTVDRIALMKSTLTSRGPIYTKLAEYRLGG